MVKKKEEISGVTSVKENNNIVLSSKYSVDMVPFYKEENYVMDNIGFIKFIKNVELQVRTSKDYKAYIRYLKEDLDPPLNHCMVYSNITDDVAPIEMHHFLFTLFDYIEIIIGWYFKMKKPFSSSRVFHTIMEEHRNNNIFIIMLSEAVHKAVHNNKFNSSSNFLDYKMAHGNIVEFLNKYYIGLNFTHINKIRMYFKKYEEYTNNPPEGFFEEVVTKWNEEVCIK